MKVITVNVNGIRSAMAKGLFNWLISENPEIICMQEIRCDLESIPVDLLNFNGYYTSFHCAKKRGYSGVAIFSKFKPDNIKLGLDTSFIDDEGRYLQFDYNDFSVISVYFPSGSSGIISQQKKFKFLDYYYNILVNQLNTNKKIIICGDYNIAHQIIDLKNWKANLNNSGFLIEERTWISNIFALGYVDTWRTLYPKDPGYTWWSNRGQAYNKNVGWRIDYQIITPNLKDSLISSTIYKDVKFSDHAPLIVEYNYNIFN